MPVRCVQRKERALPERVRRRTPRNRNSVMKMKNLVVSGIVLVALVGLGAELKSPLKAPPSKDFVEGFEAGVRYGLIQFLKDPSQQDIPKITEEAKQLYFLFVVDGGRYLMDIAGEQTNSAPVGLGAVPPPAPQDQDEKIPTADNRSRNHNYPPKTIPVTFGWMVTTNWSPAGVTTTLLGWNGEGKDPNITTYRETGNVQSNLVATVEWKGKAFDVVVESVFVRSIHRSYVISNERVYLGR